MSRQKGDLRFAHRLPRVVAELSCKLKGATNSFPSGSHPEGLSRSRLVDRERQRPLANSKG